jgi:RecA/RadA recombinase
MFFSLDELLEGGIRGGVVMELVGPSSSGKTQVLLSSFSSSTCNYSYHMYNLNYCVVTTKICIQTAASAILRGAMVVYIDTCNSFSSSRLAEVISGLSDSGNLQVMYIALCNH